MRALAAAVALLMLQACSQGEDIGKSAQADAATAGDQTPDEVSGTANGA